MAYLVPQHIEEELDTIELDAEAVVERIFDDGVGLFELMEQMPRDKRDDLDNRLTRLIEADELGAVRLTREIRRMLLDAAERCVKANARQGW